MGFRPHPNPHTLALPFAFQATSALLHTFAPSLLPTLCPPLSLLLQDGMHAQELNGLWDRKSIVCSSGVFDSNNYTQWRVWRNSLPDNQLNGERISSSYGLGQAICRAYLRFGRLFASCACTWAGKLRRVSALWQAICSQDLWWVCWSPVLCTVSASVQAGTHSSAYNASEQADGVCSVVLQVICSPPNLLLARE